MARQYRPASQARSYSMDKFYFTLGALCVTAMLAPLAIGLFNIVTL